MNGQINVKEALDEFFVQGGIYEFPVFCIARQGGRTALEILARACIMEGKHAYIGQNLTGLRSMGTNSMVLRFAETEDIPPGFGVNLPRGVMFMHEILVRPMGDPFSQLTPKEVINRLQTGILMICTSKSPEEVVYPKPFEGTVATVDAEDIFARRVGIQPAPSGITALGLFAAATGGLVKIESIKEATLAHERLSKKVREQNIACLEEAYEKARVVHNMRLPGLPEKKEEAGSDLRYSTEGSSRRQTRSMSAGWRSKLPVCDMTGCECGECLSAYFCPEGAISWQDNVIRFDYNFCKTCGTCARECVFNCITMVDVSTALKTQEEKGASA
ncbi:MAG: 2-oxoacid:acceptor oxidoreductase family protein [Deltaproteobacteria bacterium]|nr:2-oxoacid:acceptor oxidoreductase family protein [Deltaproteobacteria bacterium]